MSEEPQHAEQWYGGGTVSIERERSEIRLQFPASQQFVRIARMTLSAAVSAVAFDIEEVEDLRIAVTELVNILVDVGDGEVALRVALAPDRVEVWGETDATGTPEVDPLTAQILAAIVDDYDLTASDGTARFSFRKSVPVRSTPA